MAPVMSNSASKADKGILQWLKGIIKDGKLSQFHVIKESDRDKNN